jgi:HopA1 effector protein family
MSTALAFPTPDGPMSRVPSLEVLARSSEETELGDGVRIAGELVPITARHDRLVTTALTDAIHARYFRGDPGTSGTESPRHGRRGRDFCRRLADTLQPYLFRRDAWRFSYRTTDGVPWFVVAAGSAVDGDAASCFLHLRPGTAPDLFARVVTTLDGYGLDFRAELGGDPDACRRTDAAVLTVRRDDIPAVARAALRLGERAPFGLAPAVPAFTRRIAPGVALADHPGPGTSFGRHRSRLIAAGLVAAGRGAGPAHRRAAVLASLTTAGLHPAALHLNPGNPDFRV